MRPPAAKPVDVISDSLEILNLRCNNIVDPEIESIQNWDQVTNAFKRAQRGQPAFGKKTVIFSQHCELTLALELAARHARRNATKSRIEIGVSKACCEWCRQYLTYLQSYSTHRVFVRASHGKQTDGWMIPPNGPKQITNQMAHFIWEKFDDVVWKIQGYRRSDSNELPDSTMKDTNLKASQKEVLNRKLFGRKSHHE